jgi:hypothetical protein
MAGVSLFRLYVLRASYLFILVGLALMVWPRLIDQPGGWPVMNSVVFSMLAAVSVLAAVGIRYPLQMIPVLLFELVWKTVWLAGVALPRWLNGQLDDRAMSTVTDCVVGVALVLVAVPWKYVLDHYVRKPADNWRLGATAGAESRRSTNQALHA